MKDRAAMPGTRLMVDSSSGWFFAGNRDVQRGIVLTEILAVVAVLSLLLAVVLPALGHDRARSSRVICVNNLRQIGAAQQVWGNDHGDLPPVMVPVPQGGTRGHPLAVNAWLHYAALSNELISAVVLACPTDSGRLAVEFTGSSSNGYLNSNFRNQATSYFAAYSAFYSDPQDAVVAGDRNVTFDQLSGCSFLNYASSIGRPGARWTAALHGGVGNVLIRDASVELMPEGDVTSRFTRNSADNSAKHLAIPR